MTESVIPPEPEAVDEEEAIATLLTTLKNMSIAVVVITFDGSGDSGAIDNIEVTGLLSAEKLCEVPIPDNLKHFYTTAPNMNDVLEAAAYDMLGMTQIDWYNNDGGKGRVVLWPMKGEAIVDMASRYTETTVTYTGTRFDFSPGRDTYNDQEHLELDDDGDPIDKEEDPSPSRREAGNG